MKFEIIENGTFAALKVILQRGEAIKAESGAMVSKDVSIEIEGKMDGGLLGGIGRMLAGETMFLQTLTAGSEAGEVILAPTMIGQIIDFDLDGKSVWNIAKDGFFAGDPRLKISTKMQNLAKGLFSGEGFFVVKVSGEGKLFVSGFGAIRKIEIPAGKEYIVDNHHLVAWPENANIKIEKASKGWLSSLTSGEGLVTRIFWSNKHLHSNEKSSIIWVMDGRVFTIEKMINSLNRKHSNLLVSLNCYLELLPRFPNLHYPQTTSGCRKH